MVRTASLDASTNRETCEHPPSLTRRVVLRELPDNSDAGSCVICDGCGLVVEYRGAVRPS